MDDTQVEDMSVEQLKGRIAQQKAVIAEQRGDLQRAGVLGKCLLEQKAEQCEHIQHLAERHATNLEEKQQKICDLQSRVDVMSRKDQWQQEDVDSLRDEIAALKDTVSQQQKSPPVESYRQQAEELQLKLDVMCGVEMELRKQISDQEILLKAHLDRSDMHSHSSSFNCDEVAFLNEELTIIKVDLTQQEARNIVLSNQLAAASMVRDVLVERLGNANAEKEGFRHELSTSAKHLEEVSRSLLEQQALTESVILGQDRLGSKGNSIFSQVEDRRQVVERRMSSMDIQLRQWREKYHLEKQLNRKYKSQIAIALEMSSRKDDSGVQQLQRFLAETHVQIRSLTNEVRRLKSEEVGSVRCCAQCLNKATDKDYIRYLNEAFEKERVEACKARNQMEVKNLQYLDMVNQNVQMAKKCRELENDRSRLAAQLLEKEELQIEHLPDNNNLSDDRLRKKATDKLDTDTRHLIQEETPSDVFLPYIDVARMPKDDLAENSAKLVMLHDVSNQSEVAEGNSCADEVYRPGLANHPANSATSRADGSVSGFSSRTRTSSLDQKVRSPPQLRDSQRPVLAGKTVITPLSDKENVGLSTAHSLPFAVLPLNRKVTLADKVHVVTNDDRVKVMPLAPSCSNTVRLTPKKKGPGKPVSKVKHVKCDNHEVECKQQ